MDLNKFIEKKTKIERSKDIREATERRSKIRLDPKTPIEQAIKDIQVAVSSKWRGREINDAINLYVNVRNLRHDIWVELFDNNNLLKVKAGDIRVGDFVRSMKRKYMVDINVTNKEMNLTPDLLFYIEQYQYVLLGDVAVSVSTRAANSRKHIKYASIAKAIENAGIKVKHLNMIIHDELDNVNSTLNEFIQLDVMQNNVQNIKRATEYCRVCQKLLGDIPATVDDQNAFWSSLEIIDKLEFEAEMGVEVDIDMNNVDLTEVEPTLSECSIIDMIKVETNKLVEDNFFGSTIEDVINEIDNLTITNQDKEFTNPKATLKITDNSSEYETETNYKLVKSYIDDIRFYGDNDDIAEYITDLLPSKNQLDKMDEIYKNKEHIKKKTFKKDGVYGPFQYDRTVKTDNIITTDLNDKLTYGLKKRNKKKAPKTINPCEYDDSIKLIESMISYYGSVSGKDSFLDDTWDSKTNFEAENTEDTRKIYSYVKSTNGAQMCHSLSNLYHRITHLKTSLGSKDNIFIAPNSSFICIIPKNHSPVTNKNCDLPFIFITRYRTDFVEANGIGIEYELSVKTRNYTYYVSKLCRYNLDKIAHWDQAGHKLVATSTYLLSTCENLMNHKDRVVGIMTLLLVDSHQKTSEYLELMKYIAYMPFSDIHKLPDLVKDKFDLLIKTSLDVWMITEIKKFIVELSKIDKLDAKKPKIQLFNTAVTRESLGLSLKLPSFMCQNIRHKNVDDFVEEVQIIFTIRPKQLYGSQFMDKSINATAEWNKEYEEEVNEYKGWATNGIGEGNFPFDAKFCFSSDAIIYAQRYYEANIPATKNKVQKKLVKTKYDKYMHTNCSLRGCVKSTERRKNNNDYHTTSMEECLYQYSKYKYNEKDCTVVGMACKAVNLDIKQEYSLSEKEQRGPGRPISTPDIFTKAALMAVEKPEQAIGECVPNNIIVPGKNKLKEQCEAYKSLLSEGSTKGYKYVYQLTEDQSKFSENDNTRKYVPYIKNNRLLDPKIRALQLSVINKIPEREHLVHRIPDTISKNPNLRKYINGNNNGIRAIIGWPQGMLNFISTSIHSMADIWITAAYNKAYPCDQVITKGLVHSDDSWLAIACNSLDTFKRFCIFRMLAKKLFCLKLNVKKLWGSKYLGELVSNYNFNGNVHLSIAKVVSNCFSNLTYQNWVMDVNSQVSSIQQAYRNGAKIETLILLSTILRQQIVRSYNVNGMHNDMLYSLPIELGGYPNSSAFELGVTGLASYYNSMINNIKNNPTDECSKIILRALRLSLAYNAEKVKTNGNPDRAILEMYRNNSNLVATYNKKIDTIRDDKNVDSETAGSSKFKEVDYESITIPSRGEVFSCIKHIMPKSKKVSLTVATIKNIPFEGNGLELLVPNPKRLSEALGNLKTQTSTMLYNLAADKYTSSAKRLAISQAIQASGKVIRIGNLNPMTINEGLNFLLNSNNITSAIPDMLENAFVDETDLSTITSSAVYSANYSIHNDDKRKIVNKQPEVETKFKTVARLQNVLLFIIDDILKTHYLTEYGNNIEPIDLIIQDSQLIKKRFSAMFNFYTVKQACNLIMQQWIMSSKSRLWMQPYLRNESIVSFLEDLYGKTINNKINFNVSIVINEKMNRTADVDLINTIYTVEILNHLYKDKFQIDKIKNRSVRSILRTIDYGELNNESYLKYAILCSIYLQNNYHLEVFDNRKVYDQKYILEQKRINNKYTGKFKCMVRYGKTVMLIEGEERNISLQVNNNDINEILFGMMMFVGKNFPYYKYSHPNAWANSGFWDNTSIFSLLYLTSYSSNVTIIGKSRTANSIPIVINKNLIMKETYNNVKADRYYCDSALKTLFKDVDGQKIKISHIKQNLSCPNIYDVKLLPDEVDGYINQDLLKGKTIIHLTTRKHYNCNKQVVFDIMSKRMYPYKACLILDTWANLINKFRMTFDIIPLEDEDDNYEVISYDIQGQYAYDLIEEGLITEPEDLTAVNVNYVFDDDDRIGGVYKYSSIGAAMSQILSGHITKTEAEDVIFLLIKDDEFISLFKEDLLMSSEEVKAKYDEIEDIIDGYELQPETYSLIKTTQMHLPKFWTDIDMPKLLRRNRLVSTSNTVFHYKELIKSKILEIIYDVEKRSSHDLLLEMAIQTKKHN